MSLFSKIRPIFQRHSRGAVKWLVAGAVVVGIILCVVFYEKTPGAQWFAPINGPPSDDWKNATQPAKAWIPRTNASLDIDYELDSSNSDKRVIKITVNGDAILPYNAPEHYAEVIHANTDNAAILGDGSVLRLEKVIASIGDEKPSLIFKLENGTAKQVATQTPSTHELQLSFNENAFTRRGTLFETSSGRGIGGGGKDRKDDLIYCYNVPLIPQSSLHLLVTCQYGGTRQFIIPSEPNSFTEKDGLVIRYCGDVLCFPNEKITCKITNNYWSSHNYWGFREATRAFVFAHAIGAFEISAAHAILEDGEQIALRHASHGSHAHAHVFFGPAKTPSPIRSFSLAVSQRVARVTFTVPQIQELWPTQNVKNRFDLRLSAVDAAYFKNTGHSFHSLMTKTTGAQSRERLFFEIPSREKMDLTNKTLREAFVLYLQDIGESPDDYVTTLDEHGRLIFERKKSWGVYVWRWLFRHPDLKKLTHQTGIYPWLEKIGVKDEYP